MCLMECEIASKSVSIVHDSSPETLSNKYQISLFSIKYKQNPVSLLIWFLGFVGRPMSDTSVTGPSPAFVIACSFRSIKLCRRRIKSLKCVPEITI